MANMGVRVWGNANFKFGVGSNANISVFRNQHVGIPNVKLWHWGFKQMQGPNANGFALQWNIGLKIIGSTQRKHNFPHFVAPLPRN